MNREMRWIPVVLLTLAAACSAGMSTVGSKYVASKTVSAAQGGTVAVTDDPNLAGLTIVIPANALATNTTITVAEAAGLSASQLGGATQVGTTADLGPSGTAFAIPAVVTLPFPADGNSDVSVIGVEADGTVFTIPASSLSLSSSGSTSLVTFPVNGFTRFGAVHPHFVESGCPDGESDCADADGGDICTDLTLDNSNCGACGTVCATGLTCLSGVCTCHLTTCTSDSGSVCTDPDSDPLNCGACGNPCAAGDQCILGECAGTSSTPDGGTDGGEDTGPDAGPYVGCLTVTPGSLNFGDVGANDAGVLCTGASRTFSVANTCQNPATIKEMTVQNGSGDVIAQFSAPAGPLLPLTIQPGSAAQIYELFFEPTALGTHDAQLAISDGTGNTFLFLTGTAVATDTETDSFYAGATDGGDDEYLLMGTPSSESEIVVKVNGTQFAQQAAPGILNWTYQASLNAIVFNPSVDPPQAGAEIDVTYPIGCD